MTPKVEEAAFQMRELAASDIATRLQSANEAETRLLLIDRVLSILGWNLEEYNPEQPTPSGHYTDYRLTIDRQQRLIVEAKRYGRVQPISKRLQRAQYTNGYLRKNCGDDMAALLNQCKNYCPETGVQYAVATTGDIWIVLVGFSAGVEWDKISSFVFHSLDDVANRFNQFYDLISCESVRQNSLEEEFSSMLLVKPSTAIRPRNRIDETLGVQEVTYKRLITLFFDTFMGDITRADRSDMLEHCYVESRETIEFSKELRVLLEYDAILDEQEDKFQEASEASLRTEIDFQIASGNPKTILLVGRIGSGKSTFIQKFLTDEVQPRNQVCAVIDLINRASRPESREEEQLLAELILEKLYDRFKDQFNPYDPSIIRACFRKELEQFRYQKPELRKRREEEFILQEEQYLHELSKDKYKHLVGYAKYIITRRYKIWITLDNIDQGTDSYQAFVYSFVHQLSSDSGCVTLITMREDTFVEAQARSFLNVRSSDFVFRLRAPGLREVISGRRKYVEYILDNKRLPRPLSSNRQLVELLNWHIKAMTLGSNDALRKVISSLSLGNIRFSLQILEDYYVSYHSLFHNHYNEHKHLEVLPEDGSVDIADEFAHFIQALMLKNDWSYDERDSEIFNLFAVSEEEQGSHFIPMVILAS